MTVPTFAVSRMTLLHLLLLSALVSPAAEAGYACRNGIAGKPTATSVQCTGPAAGGAGVFPAGVEYDTSNNDSHSSKPDSIYFLPEIVVTARRVTRLEELFSRSGFIAAINMGEQKKWVKDVPAVLSSLVGVKVKQYGGLGSFATVSIRGSSSSQVQVYLDGVPINDPYIGTTDLSDLPLAGVSRIEVYRGFSPAEFGSSAIGGAINLSTEGDDFLEGGETFRMGVNSSVGSFGTRRSLLDLHCRHGALSLMLSAGFTGSDGDFFFIDERGTPENTQDDVETLRQNNDFTIMNALGEIGLSLGRWGKASLVHLFSKKECGVPGIASYQSKTARAERVRNISYLKLASGPSHGGRLRLNVTAFDNRTTERFDDPDGDITPLRQETNNTITTRGANGYTTFAFTSIPLTLKLFLESRHERFHPVSLIPVQLEGPDRLRKTFSTSLGGDIFLLGERTVLSLNEKYEWHENEFYDEPRFPWLPPSPQGKMQESTWSPHAGLRISIGRSLTIKGNIGRYHRLPTFLELFGNLGSVTGSSALEPEEGINRDVGIIVSSESLSFMDRPYIECVYMDNDVDNLILFFPNSQYTSKPVNIGSASIRGVELSFSGSIGDLLRMSGNYTYLDSRDTSPIPYYRGRRLPGRPVHEGFIALEAPVGWLSLCYELHYIGANYLDRANMKEVPPRKIHNLSLRIGGKRGNFHLTVEGRNLTDNRVSDVSGFPLPGRCFYASLEIGIKTTEKEGGNVPE